MAENLNIGLDLTSLVPQSSSQTQNGTKTTRRNLSQESIDSLIYSTLSADGGLAQLLSSQNLAGGFGSSSATLQAQDFMTKLIGELAAITAPLEETSTSTQSSKKKASVICTELERQGLLDTALYEAGREHFEKMSNLTKTGYWSWATKVVPWMRKSQVLSYLLAPVVESRYEMITTGRWTLCGAATIYIGQPICWLIGLVITLSSAGDSDGRAEPSA